MQWSNSTSYATQMLKTVDRAAEKHVKHARTISTIKFHSTDAPLATGSADEALGSPYQRHEGIKHDAAGAIATALSLNVSSRGWLYPACMHL